MARKTTKASTESLRLLRKVDAQIQRMNNTIKSLFNSGLGVVLKCTATHLKIYGSSVSNADAKA